MIVDDDFFTGGRLYARDISPDGDPIEAMADYYLNPVPCTTYHYPESWVNNSKQYSPYGDYVVDLVKRNRAKGVVFLAVNVLRSSGHGICSLEEEIGRGGYPVPLSVCRYEFPLRWKPIRTRVQAFMETMM